MGERALKFVLALRPKENRKRGENYFLCGPFFFFQILLLLFFFKKGKCHPTVGGFLCFQVQAHAFCQLWLEKERPEGESEKFTTLEQQAVHILSK